jgi:hypothetical protein
LLRGTREGGFFARRGCAVPRPVPAATARAARRDLHQRVLAGPNAGI